LHYVLENFSDDIFRLYLQITLDFYCQSVPVWIITFLNSNCRNAWKINIKSYTDCQISNVNLTQIWIWIGQYILTVIIMMIPLNGRKRQSLAVVSKEQAITASLKTLLKWEKELHTNRFYYGGWIMDSGGVLVHNLSHILWHHFIRSSIWIFE
jgi:hypothetical protein